MGFEQLWYISDLLNDFLVVQKTIYFLTANKYKIIIIADK